MKYEILWVASKEARRDYRARQAYANDKHATCYVEHHFNAKEYDRPGVQDNPASVLVCKEASQKAKDFGASYVRRIVEKWHYPNGGVDLIGPDRNGHVCLATAKMPAILLEPLYVSDPEQATLAMSDIGKQLLAQILADTITEHFPEGGLIALSVGHKFKVSSPYDRGAPVAGGKGLGEADIAEDVLHLAAAILTEST